MIVCLRLMVAGSLILTLAGCASSPPLVLPTLGTALPDPSHPSARVGDAHDLIGGLAAKIIKAPFATESTSSLLVLPLQSVKGRPLDFNGLSAALNLALTATGHFTLCQPPAPLLAALSASREQRLFAARSSGARYLVQGVLEFEGASPVPGDAVTMRVEVTDLTTSLVVWMDRQTGPLPAPALNPAP